MGNDRYLRKGVSGYFKANHAPPIFERLALIATCSDSLAPTLPDGSRPVQCLLPEVDRGSLTHYGPNAFVQRRETSVQSSLLERSFIDSVGARKSQTVHPALFVLPAVCDAPSQHFGR